MKKKRKYKKQIIIKRPRVGNMTAHPRKKKKGNKKQ